MKYEVKFTKQFKKDLKLAKKQNKDLDKLFEVVNILAEGAHLTQGIVTMICPVIKKGQENVTLSQTGFLFMKSGMRCLCSCFIALERTRSYLRNSLGIEL